MRIAQRNKLPNQEIAKRETRMDAKHRSAAVTLRMHYKYLLGCHAVTLLAYSFVTPRVYLCLCYV